MCGKFENILQQNLCKGYFLINSKESEVMEEHIFLGSDRQGR